MTYWQTEIGKVTGETDQGILQETQEMMGQNLVSFSNATRREFDREAKLSHQSVLEIRSLKKRHGNDWFKHI